MKKKYLRRTKPDEVAQLAEKIIAHRADVAPYRLLYFGKLISEFSYDAFLDEIDSPYLDSFAHSVLSS